MTVKERFDVVADDSGCFICGGEVLTRSEAQVVVLKAAAALG